MLGLPITEESSLNFQIDVISLGSKTQSMTVVRNRTKILGPIQIRKNIDFIFDREGRRLSYHKEITRTRASIPAKCHLKWNNTFP